MSAPSRRTPHLHVAFLRAINVGGRGVVKMEALRRAFTAAGCRDVRTVLQSGNVVFEAPPGARPAFARKLEGTLARLLGPDTVVIFRSMADLERMLQAAPFGAASPRADVKRYVVFLASRPRGKLALPPRDHREALRVVGSTGREVFVASGRKKNGFYGFPNQYVEKALGVPATSRNWNTIRRIVERFT